MCSLSGWTLRPEETCPGEIKQSTLNRQSVCDYEGGWLF